MAYNYWVEELDLLAPSTRDTHLHYFNLFIGWLGVDAEELYNWQRRLVDDGDPRSNRELVNKFREWGRLMMKREGWGGGTVLRASYAVKSFFAANALVFPIKPRDIPKFSSSGARVVLLDEIRVLVDRVAGEHRVRNRALLMMLKDTGLRRSDVSRLDVGDYLGARVVGDGFRVIDEYTTKKTGELAWVHMGPEACEAVDLYLGDRDRGPLFLNRDGVRMYEGILTSTVIRCARRHLENPHRVSPHSFRKFHRTALEAVIPESYVKKLQGKSTDPYIHPEQTGELTEAYVKHYDVLRVFRDKQRIDELEQLVEDERVERYSLEDKINFLARRLDVKDILDKLEKEKP